MTDGGRYSERWGRGFPYIDLFCKVDSHSYKKPSSIKTMSMLV